MISRHMANLKDSEANTDLPVVTADHVRPFGFRRRGTRIDEFHRSNTNVNDHPYTVFPRVLQDRGFELLAAYVALFSGCADTIGPRAKGKVVNSESEHLQTVRQM